MSILLLHPASESCLVSKGTFLDCFAKLKIIVIVVAVIKIMSRRFLTCGDVRVTASVHRDGVLEPMGPWS